MTTKTSQASIKKQDIHAPQERETDLLCAPVPGSALDIEMKNTCPLKIVGCSRGIYYFVNRHDELRRLKPSILFHHIGLIALFGGKTTWLQRYFPRTYRSHNGPSFNIMGAGAWLMYACHGKGHFDPPNQKTLYSLTRKRRK